MKYLLDTNVFIIYLLTSVHDRLRSVPLEDMVVSGCQS